MNVATGEVGSWRALWVVMPVYNEEKCISEVVTEWLPVLRVSSPNFTMCVLNDGSTDGTLDVLRSLEASIPELKVIEKPNSGHGQTCLAGYRLALGGGPSWVLQIDSDGQCDPQFFPELWAARRVHSVIYGYRRRRKDGIGRYFISRLVSIVTLLGTGEWLRDANVPYRLMRDDTLSGIVSAISPDFHLANVFLAVLQRRRYGIHWIDIEFRKRTQGSPDVKVLWFALQGWRLLRQLLRYRRVVVGGGGDPARRPDRVVDHR